MFLPRKVIVGNLAAAIVLAPFAVHAIGANAGGDVPPMARIYPAVEAAPLVVVTKPVLPSAEPKCARVRVVYPGPAGLAPTCPAPLTR